MRRAIAWELALRSIRQAEVSHLASVISLYDWSS